MEISSVPFLNSEDFSHFYNYMFPEMDDDDNFGVNQSPINDSKKRRKLNDDNSNNVAQKLDQHQELKNGNQLGFYDDNEHPLNNTEIKGMLTSLLQIQQDEQQSQKEFDFLQHKSLINSNFESESSLMANFCLDQTRARKRGSPSPSASASTSTGAAATAGAGSSGEAPAGHHRRLWVKDRSKDWWDQRNHPDFSDEQFKKDFRMSKATFQFVCDKLDSVVTKKNTMLREAIPVRQRVAVCIWRLATGEPLRLVSKRFGLGISTCHKLVLEVCSAIRTVLMPHFLRWPAERSREVESHFEAVSGIKGVVGAMYTTHVPIIAPKVNVSAYFNRRHTERNQRTSYSITVQGVVDARGVFSDICIGWPGSMPDDQVLEKSAIFQRAAQGEMRDAWIVGGAGYPMLDWMLVPYARQNLTWAQHAFNERVGEAQRVAKDAFSRLKGRWSCLQKRTEVKLADLPVVLGACCTLHNICELRNEEIDPEYRIEIFDDEMVASAAENGLTAPAQKRDQIAHNLLHHNRAGTSFLQ